MEQVVKHRTGQGAIGLEELIADVEVADFVTVRLFRVIQWVEPMGRCAYLATAWARERTCSFSYTRRM